jgi:hypothetical protein
LKFLSINRTIKADFNLGSIPNAGIELISGAIRESDLVFACTQKMVRGRAKTHRCSGRVRIRVSGSESAVRSHRQGKFWIDVVWDKDVVPARSAERPP